MVNFVVSPPSAYVVSTRPTVRLSDQEFEHIIKDEQDNTKKNHQKSSPPDEKTLVRMHFQIFRKISFINIKRFSICRIITVRLFFF